MIDFFHRHQSALRRLSFLLLAAVLGLLLIAQIAAFAAARIFSYAMNKQHMLRGHISVEKISADIAGYVSFENLLWTDDHGIPILFVPDGKIKVRPEDILRGKLRATAISEIRLHNASAALQFDKNMDVDLINKTAAESEPAEERAETLHEKIANFKRNGQKMKMNIHLENCQLEAFYENRHFLLSHVDMHLNIDTDDSLFVDLSSGKFGGTAIGDSVKLYGDIDMKSDEHTIAMNVSFYGVDPASLGLGNNIHDKLTLIAEAGGPVASPKAEGKITMEQLHIPALSFSHLDGHVFYHHGKMKFTDVTGRVYGGTVKASGNYDIDTRAYNIHLAGKKLDSRYPAKDAAIFCYVDLEGDIRCDGNPKEIISEGTFTSGSGHYKLIPFKKIQGAFHNRGKELDFYDVSIETALGTFSTDAFHIRNGKLQLGDITLTNDRGEETDVKGAMEHAENTFRQIGQDIKEIKEQISGLKP